MKKIYLFLLFVSGYSLNLLAQCPTGQLNVTVDVQTDSWGYECFWDLTPTGNGCGNGALFTFGNTAQVNCNSGGTQVATAGGYGDNTTTTESLGCLTVGSCFDINYVDDYGDGGANFTVKINGVVSFVFINDQTVTTATHTFCVANPPVHDAEISTEGSKYLQIPLSQSLNFIAPATIVSAGTGTITGVKANVSVTAGGTQVHAVSSTTQTLAPLASGTFTVAPYTPQSYGPHTVKYTSQMNETDEVPASDTVSYVVNITDTVYALDDGTAVDLIGLGAGELGYLANLFDISNATSTSSVSVYLGNGSNTAGAPAVDSVFNIRVFSTDPLGNPISIIGSASGIIENVAEKWYTVSFASPLALAPGKYMVALEEEFYMQELGFSDVFHPQTSFIYALTQVPWSPVEDFNFPALFMIRLNLASGGLAVPSIVDNVLDLYPNPTSTDVTIAKTKAGASVQVFNQMGQLIISTATVAGNTVIDVRSLENGIYTIKTIEDNQIGVAKFTKQ